MERRRSAVDRWSFVAVLALCLFHQSSGQTIKWSECSRSCGGGVRRALNGCVQYGPDSECLSYNKSYVSCNTQPCPPGTPDFRTAQCEQYEKKPISGKFYKLESYISATSGATCELYCRTKGDKFYLKFSDTVKDGTPCGPNLSGICVENVCKPVGCDRELGSPKEFDECMVCGGDGTTCKKYSRTINLNTFKSAGYHKVTVLPKGSTSISIRNPDGQNRTFLALTSSDGEYLLNGHHKIANSRSLEVHGVYFNYTRFPESLTAPGPTNEELVVMVLLTRPMDAQLTFELYLPLGESSNSAPQNAFMEDKIYGVDEEYDTEEQAAFLRFTDESSYKVDETSSPDKPDKSDPSGLDYVTFAEDLPQFRTNQYFAARSNDQWKHASAKSSGQVETKVESGESGNDGDDEEESSSGESPDVEVSITEKSTILDLDKETSEPGKTTEDGDDDDGDDGDLEASAVTSVATAAAEAVSPLGEVTESIPTGVDEEDDDDDDDDGTGIVDGTEEASGEPSVEESALPTTLGKDDDDDGDEDGKGDDKDKDDDDDDDKKVSSADEDEDKKKGSGDDDKDDDDDDDDDGVEKKVSGDDDHDDDKTKVEEEDDDDDDNDLKKKEEDGGDDDDDDDAVVDKKASGDDKKATGDDDDDDDDDEEVEKKASGIDDDDDDGDADADKKETDVDDDDDDGDKVTEKKDDDDDDDDDEDDDDEEEKKASGVDDDDSDASKKETDDDDVDKETVKEDDDFGDDDDDDDDGDEVTTQKQVEEDEDESGVVDKDDEDDDGDDDGDDDDDDDDKVKKGSGDVITTEAAKTTETEKVDKVEISIEDKEDDDDDGGKDKDDGDDDVGKDEDEVKKVTEKVVKEDLTLKKDDDDDEDDDDDNESGVEASGEHVVATTERTQVVVVDDDDDDETTKPDEDEDKEDEDVTTVVEDHDDDDDDLTTAKDDDDDDDVKKGSGEEVTTAKKDDDDDDDDKVTEKREKDVDDYYDYYELTTTTAKPVDDDDDDDDETTTKGSGDDKDDDDESGDGDDDKVKVSKETTTSKAEVKVEEDEDEDKKVETTDAKDDDDYDDEDETTTKGSGDDDDDETTTKGSGDDEGDDEDETTTKGSGDDEDGEEVKEDISTVKAVQTETADDDDDDDVTTIGSGKIVDGDTTPKSVPEDDEDDDDEGIPKKEVKVETAVEPTTAESDGVTTDLDEVTESHVDKKEEEDDDDKHRVKFGEDEDDEDGVTAAGSGVDKEATASGFGDDEDTGSGVTRPVKETTRVQEVTEEVKEVTMAVTEHSTVAPAVHEVSTHAILTVKPDGDEDDKVTFLEVSTDRVVAKVTTDSELESTEPLTTKTAVVDATPVPPAESLTPHPITPPREEEDKEEGEKEPEEKPLVGTEEPLVKHPFDEFIVETETAVDVESVACSKDEFSEYHEEIVKEKFTSWYVGAWDPCEDGKQRREVVCVVYDDEEQMTITQNQQRCPLPRPHALRRCRPEEDEPVVFISETFVQSCYHEHCKQFEWITSEWIGCSSSCEEEYDSRLVFCSEKSKDSDHGLIVSEDHCRGLEKPDSRRECHRQEIACEMKPKWFATEWGECSTKCGVGTQTRRVFCGKVMRQTVGDTILLTQEENCDQHTKVPHIQFCRRDCEVRWVSGPYGTCSASCGGGIRTRQVMCLKGHQLSDECDAHHKPFSSQECNYHSCPYDIPELPCESSLYGCCQDGITPAESFGPDGCRQADPHPAGPCTVSQFGCCPDGVTAAQGYEGQGCEEAKKVRTDDLESCVESEEGSGDVKCVVVPETQVSCHETEFHCCPDGLTPASGPHFQGCPGLDCRHQEYGCCQDGVTVALGPHGQGCPEYIPPRAPIQTRPCAEHFYGCCKDGVTLAQGPEFEGCPEAGEAYKIDCADTEYGCCLDLKTPASGPHHAGCPLEHRKKGICFLPSESGTCQNHTIMWYYDSLIGECSRFWYSGCGTNGNLFESEEDCKAVCISPPDHDKCFLPKVVGRCRASLPRFFYNVETQSCESFSYGGCGENGNNFDSQQACDLQCTIPLTYNVCQLPSSRGPCEGSYPRWYYDHQTKQCQQFYYGGCLGNENRFETFEDCQTRCAGPIETVCAMEPDSGPCNSVIPFWHFNSTTDTCERFYFGGCQGNLNRFTTKQKCLHTCLLPKKESHSICNLPHEFGLCTSYFDKWYFDQADGYCKKFVYSGCGGTLNRFDSEAECRSSCNAKEPVADDVCSLPWSTGPCTDYTIMYYYSKDHQACDRFYYGGCEGNANRYNTEEECLNQCGTTSYVPGPDHVPVEPSPDPWTERPRETTTVGSTLTASEICSLNYDVGPCSDYAIYYYFDASSQSCNRFYYGGCEGNLNRYETEEECLRQCTQTPDQPTVEAGLNTTELTVQEICSLAYDTGPCADYTILYYYSSEHKSCMRFYYGGCNGNPNRFNTEEECTNFCDPKPVKVAFSTPARCTLGAEHGPCMKRLARWHYDHETMVCRMFDYGGCDGNRNRFMTRESCLKSCHPDHYEERSVDYSAESQDVDKEAIRETEEHQPKEVEEGTKATHTEHEEHVHTSSICSLPSERGPCSDWEVQWYFDSAHENCLQFWYGGCPGNENRFATQEECEARCKSATASPSEPYPSQPVHVVKEEAEAVEPAEETYSAEHVCKLPSSTGPCANYEIKWHFNPEHGDCVEFYYGGCEGNANRFESKEECLNYCQPQAEDVVKIPIGEFCNQPYEVGQCSGHELRYYWDPDKNQCRPFYYTGCNGNQNNFETVGHCYHHCGMNLKEVERYTRESCTQPRETGTCYDFEIRYYFDYEKKDCLGFYFGGCNGNSNNFHSYEDCRAICLPESSQPVCPPCDFHCAGQLRYETDEYGCQRCYCDHQTHHQEHHHQQHHREQEEPQVTIDTQKQLLPAFEYTTFVCRGHIEPGYSVMVERDGSLVGGITAQEYGQVSVVFNVTESGNYKCVVQTPSGHSFESPGNYVNVYHVFLNASFEDNQLVLSCEGFGLDQYAGETFAVFKKMDDDNHILMEERLNQPALTHKLHLSIEQEVDHSGKYICELHSRHFNFSSNYALVTIRLHGSPDTDAYYHGENSGGFTLPVHDHALPNEFDASGLYDGRQQLRQGLRVKLSVESRESEVMFKCAVLGVSQNENVQVRWERNNKEIYTIQERVPQDGFFHISISNSDLDDSGTYLCVIEHHGRHYTSEPLNLQRVVPGQITLHAYKQLLDDGELLRVDCTAGVSTGTPITLQSNGQMLHPVTTSFILNGVRAEFQLVPQSSRNYKCVAHLNREVTLDSPTAWIPLKNEVRAKLIADKASYSEGDQVQLKCEISGVDSYEKDFSISFKQFVPSTGDVLKHYSGFGKGLDIVRHYGDFAPVQDVLRLDNVGDRHGGHYRCEVLFPELGFRVSSSPVHVNVTRPAVKESSCVDMPTYADCSLVVRARFCNHQYFQKFCCRSCREAGLI